jgi:hypothetical protein
MTTEQQTLQRNKLLGVGIFAAATLGFFLYARAKPGKATLPVIYPKESATATGRVFQTVHTPKEFDMLLSTPAASRGTLFATFVRLGEEPSNSMATHMWEIVRNVETPNTSTVCVELAGGRNNELVQRYMVNTIPSVVALKKTLPSDTYIDDKVKNSNTDINHIDKEKLRQWISNILTR